MQLTEFVEEQGDVGANPIGEFEFRQRTTPPSQRLRRRSDLESGRPPERAAHGGAGVHGHTDRQRGSHERVVDASDVAVLGAGDHELSAGEGTGDLVGMVEQSADSSTEGADRGRVGTSHEPHGTTERFAESERGEDR